MLVNEKEQQVVQYKKQFDDQVALYIEKLNNKEEELMERETQVTELQTDMKKTKEEVKQRELVHTKTRQREKENDALKMQEFQKLTVSYQSLMQEKNVRFTMQHPYLLNQNTMSRNVYSTTINSNYSSLVMENAWLKSQLSTHMTYIQTTQCENANNKDRLVLLEHERVQLTTRITTLETTLETTLQQQQQQAVANTTNQERSTQLEQERIQLHTRIASLETELRQQTEALHASQQQSQSSNSLSSSSSSSIPAVDSTFTVSNTNINNNNNNNASTRRMDDSVVHLTVSSSDTAFDVYSLNVQVQSTEQVTTHKKNIAVLAMLKRMLVVFEQEQEEENEKESNVEHQAKRKRTANVLENIL